MPAISNYINNMPEQVPIKASQGFITTTAISVLSGLTLNISLIRGAIAVTATFIEAVTRPIIKATFPNQPIIASAIQIFIPQIVAISLATSLSPLLATSCKMASFISLIAWLMLNEDFYEKKEAIATVL